VKGQRRYRLGSARIYWRYIFISVFYGFLLSETVFLMLVLIRVPKTVPQRER